MIIVQKREIERKQKTQEIKHYIHAYDDMVKNQKKKEEKFYNMMK